MFYNHELEQKQLVIKAGNFASQIGLVERTWGNVSIRLDTWHFAISPTGASYKNLKPEDIPTVNLKDLNFVGKRRPSSELLIHSEIYNYYPNVSFILHTHQKFASLLSLFFANRQGSFDVLDKYKNILGKTISIAEYAQGGTKKIAENVIKAFTTFNGHSFSTSNGIVLMAAHGVVCFASNFDEAFSMVQSLEDFANSLILNILKNHNILLETNGNLQTYTKKTFSNNIENSIVNKLCSIIFNEAPDVSFVTLSTLPISKYISKMLETDIFPHAIDLLFRGIPAYFDDVAQIIGESAIIISDDNDINLLQKNVGTLFARCNALIIPKVGVLFFSEKEDETHYMASIFEKNALAFILYLSNQNIIPLTKENASSLHKSFMQGYSKLKNT